MIGRRGVLGLGAGLVLPWRVAAAPAGPGALHALVVGINAYRLQPLHGCVNDARLIESHLRPHAASITTLIDQAASREALMRAWAATAARCRPGDRMLFAYSGHGDRMPERIPGSEADGMDDFLVLQPFHPREAPTEILIDNDMEVMLAELGRRQVGVVLVADCCHSGTMTRGVHPAASGQVSIRTLEGGYAREQLLAALAGTPPPPPSPPPEQLAHVAFFAAGQETEAVPELEWEGQMHGALSVGFATGIAGAADADRDGRITEAELIAHILRSVRALAESRQHPELHGTRSGTVAVFRAAGPAPPEPGPAVAAGAEPPVRLRIQGGASAQDQAQLSRLAGATPAGPAEQADLIWQPRTGEVVSELGDVLARDISAEQLAGVVQRERALRRLRRMATTSTLDLRLVALAAKRKPFRVQDHDAAHPAGTLLALEIDGLRQPNLVVFNLAGDGRVQLLYPTLQRDSPTVATGSLRLPDFRVEPPFGADHAVALAVDHPLGGLVETLRRLHGRPEPMAAAMAVQQAVAGAQWQLGITGIFSRPAA